jgi:hypothetical protein
MNKFLFLVLLGLSMFGTMVPSFAMEASPIAAGECKTSCSRWVNETGVVFPTKSTTIRDYFNANGLTPIPLTSGLGNGLQFGLHRLVGNGATIGALVTGNAFYGSGGGSTTQIYNFSAYFVARGYLNGTWRNGAFVELGCGPEVSAASFADSAFVYQGNISTRLGVGYNYQFNDDITVGLSAVVTPTVTAGSYLDGSKVIVNILW